MKKKSSILVTGGAGFIGSHIVDELIKLGYQVIVLDNLSGGFRENLNERAVFIKGSITNQRLVDELFVKYKFTYVFHLAAYAAEGLSHFIRNFNYTNNLIGSVSLINAAIRANTKCFIFASSIAVYGSNQLPMKEDLVPRPEDPYGIAKYAIELDLEAAHRLFGLNYIVFRPHNVYGERQNIGDKYRNVIGIFLNQAMQGKSLSVFGDGTQKRAFSYVGDIAPVIARAAFNKKIYNQILNVGADEVYSINELIGYIDRALSKHSKVVYYPARKEVHVAYADHAKSKKLLNYQDLTTLEKGIKRMAVWAQKIGPRRSKKFSHIEILRGLPTSWQN